MLFFLPERGIHHCLPELYTRLSPTSVVAFVNFQGAFDTANKEIILDQLVEFGVKGRLLKWIRDYLNNRTACVLFNAACITQTFFEMGTPEGGVLSPLLFNVLMHRLLSLLPDIRYADHICIHSNLQDIQLLHTFSYSSAACGLIISTEKNRIFSYRNPRTLPDFTMGGRAVPRCSQYLYLGALVRAIATIPARQRIHPIVKDLLDRLAALHPRQVACQPCRRSLYPFGQNFLCVVHEICR